MNKTVKITVFVFGISFIISASMLSNYYRSTRPIQNRTYSITTLVETPLNRRIIILWYNRPDWLPVAEQLNKEIRKNCIAMNCRFTENKENFQNHSAVIFSLQDELDERNLSFRLANRNPEQPWIFFHAESPINVQKHATWYRHKQWRNTMNWSLTYRLDSDITYPYGTFVPSPVYKKNFSMIFRQKDKFAAWFVSNCDTVSRREVYVKRLQEYGIPVDIFGDCSNIPVERNLTSVNTMLEKHYKFYISFENSLCDDYITEKFYDHFNSDIILIVRGGADYTKIVSNGTYINTKDFPTIKDLARYLLRLNSSEELYTDYLKRRNAFPYQVDTSRSAFVSRHCSVCEKVMEARRNRRQYDDINPYVFQNRCRDPTDV